VARRLVLDALALGSVLPAVPPTSLVDLGSGAGFPGLPLAILWPSCTVTLVESRERKHHFQRTAIRSLGISNARAVRGRAEDLEPTAHQIAVAQAMGKPARVLTWMRGWVGPGGWMALALADPPPPVAVPSGIRCAEPRTYRVPLGGPSRSVWLGQLE
jgi:16S rRNA G527 N7-methylase RsmG